jgi:hypothetical protein
VPILKPENPVLQISNPRVRLIGNKGKKILRLRTLRAGWHFPWSPKIIDAHRRKSKRREGERFGRLRRHGVYLNPHARPKDLRATNAALGFESNPAGCRTHAQQLPGIVLGAITCERERDGPEKNRFTGPVVPEKQGPGRAEAKAASGEAVPGCAR